MGKLHGWIYALKKKMIVAAGGKWIKRRLSLVRRLKQFMLEPRVWSAEVETTQGTLRIKLERPNQLDMLMVA